MKYGQLILNMLIVLFAVLSLSGCEIVGGVFKAGMWVGVIMVVLIVALVFYLISRFR